MKIIDLFKSKEEFELIYDTSLDMYHTYPIPDESEIGKYYEDEGYISHSNKIKGAFDFVYQLAKQFMLKKKLKWVRSYIRQGKALDIGCGTGDFLWMLQQNNFNVVGVEPNAKAREIASYKKLTVLKELKEVTQQKFDFVSMWHVLEHVADLHEFFNHLNELTNSKAYVFVAVPNFKSYDAAYYKQYWAAYDVPRHLHHFSQQAIQILFEKNGYKLLSTKSLVLDAYYVSMLSEKYRGKSSVINAIKIGFTSNWKARKSNEWSSKLYILQKSK